MKKIEPEQRKKTQLYLWSIQTSPTFQQDEESAAFFLLRGDEDSRRRLKKEIHLGGTANTSGCSSVKPSGSLSTRSRVSTHVWAGLRWAGTTASHLLRTGREQSAGGGGRSVVHPVRKVRVERNQLTLELIHQHD